MRACLAGIILAVSLCSCALLPPSLGGSESKGEQASASQQQQLFDTASTLADEVKAGRLTRIEAVDRLNAQRLALVGSNSIDDDVFKTYRHLTVALQSGTITQSVLRDRLKAKLEQARSRYEAMLPWQRPTPVFTNLLLQIYGQKKI